MSIFYKITNHEGKVSFLFGTIHLDDVDVVTLPFEVKDAFDKASHCVTETNCEIATPETIERLLKNWQNNQKQFVNQIPESYLLAASKYFNVTSDVLKATPPILLFLKELPISNHHQILESLDLQLLKQAKLNNKTLGYLEPAEEQIKALLCLYMNILEQIELCTSPTESLTSTNRLKALPTLKTAYLQQNINSIMRELYFPKSERLVQYLDRLFSIRDCIMAENMNSYLNLGNAFFAVGAGHLSGITTKLRNQGYTVEPVPIGKRYYPIAGSVEDGEKVKAFKKIYSALYGAQTSAFKRRGFLSNLNTIVSFHQILDYIQSNPNSRSKTAWNLAEQHYKNVSSTNRDLLKAICHEGYAKSSSFFGLFRQTKTNLDDDRSVAEASSTTRTGIVRDILNGPML